MGGYRLYMNTGRDARLLVCPSNTWQSLGASCKFRTSPPSFTMAAINLLFCSELCCLPSLKWMLLRHLKPLQATEFTATSLVCGRVYQAQPDKCLEWVTSTAVRQRCRLSPALGKALSSSWSPGLKKWVVHRPSKFYRLLQAGAHPFSDWHLLFQFSTSRWRSEIAFPGPDPRVSWLAARAPSRWPSSPEILCCVPCVPFVPCGRPGIFRRAPDVQSSSRVAKLQLALCTP